MARIISLPFSRSDYPSLTFPGISSCFAVAPPFTAALSNHIIPRQPATDGSPRVISARHVPQRFITRDVSQRNDELCLQRIRRGGFFFQALLSRMRSDPLQQSDVYPSRSPRIDHNIISIPPGLSPPLPSPTVLTIHARLLTDHLHPLPVLCLGPAVFFGSAYTQ